MKAYEPLPPDLHPQPIDEALDLVFGPNMDPKLESMTREKLMEMIRMLAGLLNQELPQVGQ